MEEVKIVFNIDECDAIAYLNDVEIGRCDYLEFGDYWNIVHTFVDPDYQGKGIAKKLVYSIIENANKNSKLLRADCEYAKRVIDKYRINTYLNQDIDNPKYLFHGSPKKLDKVSPQKSHDSNNTSINIDTAVFLFPSFLKSTAYAFKDKIKENSEGLDWNFIIPNDNTLPLMIMENVFIDEDIIGYIYVFNNEEDIIKDKNSYQYKAYKELKPIDIVEIKYSDYKDYYEVRGK